MRRSLVFSLAVSLALMRLIAPSYAATFTYVTLDVPSGWTATESDTGIVRLTNNSDNSDNILIQLGSLGSGTLQQVANNYYSGLNGTGGLQQSDEYGYYYFRSQTSNGVVMLNLLEDHNTDSRIPAGYYSYMGITVGGTASDVFFNDVYSTLQYHAGGSSSPNSDTPSNGGNTTGGSVQTFTSMRVLVPSGWTASENDDGDTVRLRNQSDSTQFIDLFLGNVNGRTLREIAEYWYGEFNGQNLSQPSSTSGYYRFAYRTGGGTTVTIFIDDSTTDSRVLSGYYWLQAVSNPVDDELFNEVLRSIVFTVSGNGGGNSNNVSSSGGGGGGCSAGFGSLALLALCSAFIVRKSR